MKNTSLLLGLVLVGALVACSSGGDGVPMTDGGAGSGKDGGGAAGSGGQGGSDGGGAAGNAGADGGPIAITCAAHDKDPVDSTCTAYADTYCKFALTCQPDFLTFFKSADSCQSVVKAECVGELGLTGTGKTAGRIWAETENIKLAKDCLIPPTDFDASCYKQGSLAAGTACAKDSQCKAGKCETDGTSTCGKCVAVPQVGEACTKSGDTCAEGSFCDSESGKCKAKVGSGEKCADPIECKTGTFCKAGGTCAPLLAAGEKCATTYECRTGTICSSDNTCVAVTFGKEGDTCALALGKSCELGSFCQKGNKCQKITADSTCGGGEFLKCGPGQYCLTENETSKCKAAAAIGQACTDASTCDGFPYTACISGKCGFADATTCK